MFIVPHRRLRGDSDCMLNNYCQFSAGFMMTASEGKTLQASGIHKDFRSCIIDNSCAYYNTPLAHILYEKENGTRTRVFGAALQLRFCGDDKALLVG